MWWSHHRIAITYIFIASNAFWRTTVTVKNRCKWHLGKFRADTLRTHISYRTVFSNISDWLVINFNVLINFLFTNIFLTLLEIALILCVISEGLMYYNSNSITLNQCTMVLATMCGTQLNKCFHNYRKKL